MYARVSSTLLVIVLLGVLSSAIGVAPASGQPTEPAPETPEVLILLDHSGSMDNSIDDGRKLDLAVETINLTLSDLADQGTSAVVLGYEGDCHDWPPGAVDNLSQVRQLDWEAYSQSVWAGGSTPTGVALMGAFYRLGIVDAQAQPTGGGSGTIVLISDGESNGCVDPCDVASDYGAGYITVHTVAFDLAQSLDAIDELSCIANVTGGVAVTVSRFDALQEEVRRLAQLRGNFTIQRVEAIGYSLDVDLTLSTNLGLSDAHLRIVGPAEFIEFPRQDTSLMASEDKAVTHPLGDDLTGGTGVVVRDTWYANPCASLSKVVVFTLVGVRAQGPYKGTMVEELVHVTTVRNILLEGMTEDDVTARCSALRSASQDHLLTGSEELDEPTPNRLSTALNYASIGLMSAFSAALGTMSRRHRLFRLLSTGAGLADTTDDVVGIGELVRGVTKESKTTSVPKGGSRWLRDLSKTGLAVGTLAAGVNCVAYDPTIGCAACSGTSLAAGALTGAGIGAACGPLCTIAGFLGGAAVALVTSEVWSALS